LKKSSDPRSLHRLPETISLRPGDRAGVGRVGLVPFPDRRAHVAPSNDCGGGFGDRRELFRGSAFPTGAPHREGKLVRQMLGRGGGGGGGGKRMGCCSFGPAVFRGVWLRGGMTKGWGSNWSRPKGNPGLLDPRQQNRFCGNVSGVHVGRYISYRGWIFGLCPRCEGRGAAGFVGPTLKDCRGIEMGVRVGPHLFLGANGRVPLCQVRPLEFSSFIRLFFGPGTISSGLQEFEICRHWIAGEWNKKPSLRFQIWPAAQMGND